MQLEEGLITPSFLDVNTSECVGYGKKATWGTQVAASLAASPVRFTAAKSQVLCNPSQ